MDTDIRRPLQVALSRLHSDRERIDKKISAIQELLKLDEQPSTNGPRRVSKTRAREGMSLAARKAVSRRMKAYWAKRRKAKGKKKAA